MNHADLVSRATRWLRNTLHCRVVLSELVTAAWETPDAVGWVGTTCIVVECKTSRSDFRADAKKFFRQMPKHGVGDWRFYLTAPGLLDGLTLPDGWGWYEVRGRSVVHRGGETYTNMGFPPHQSRESRDRYAGIGTGT